MRLESWLKTNLQLIFWAQQFRKLRHNVTSRHLFDHSPGLLTGRKTVTVFNSFRRSEQFIESFVFHATSDIKKTGSTELNRYFLYSQSRCIWYLHVSAAKAIWSHHHHLGSPKSQQRARFVQTICFSYREVSWTSRKLNALQFEPVFNLWPTVRGFHLSLCMTK